MHIVAFCIPGNTFSNRFLQSWTKLINRFGQYGIQPIYSWSTGSDIYKVRNSALSGNPSGGKKQLPFRGLAYDYIMWIDSDQVFDPEHFEKLLKRMEINKDISILSGIYKYYPGDRISAIKRGKSSIKNRTEDGQLTPASIKDKHEPIEVDISGMGFMLVRQGVFEKLNYPWFSQLEKAKEDENYAGEDTAFCHRAKERGFSVYIDPEVIIGHEKPIIF